MAHSHAACLAIVEVSSVGQGDELELYINDPKSKRLVTLDEAAILRHHWAAWSAGNYQICVLNKSTKHYQFQMSITTGIEAIDYSSIVTKKHLQPVDLSAQKVQDQIE